LAASQLVGRSAVITKPTAEKKPGRRQDCVVAASVAGVVSRIGQGENHGT
jgi:hypothetical protein